MAQIIGVSLSTIRRMAEYGLLITAEYALTDEELDSVVREIHHDFPMCGNRQMHGFCCLVVIEFSSKESEKLNGELIQRVV